MKIEDNKKKIIISGIGVMILLVLVISATYAYFSVDVDTTNAKPTIITGKTPQAPSVAISKFLDDGLHLNLDEIDMTFSRIGSYYAASGEDNYYTSLEDARQKIIQVSAAGEPGVKYACSGNVTVDISGEMTDVLEKDDVIMNLYGLGLDETLDLYNIKSTKTQTYPVEFVAKSNNTEYLEAYAKLENKNTVQDYLAEKDLKIDITADDLVCDIVTNLEIPTVELAESPNDVNGNSFTINATASKVNGTIDRWCYKIGEDGTYTCEKSSNTTFTHTFNFLNADTDYTVYIYAVDKNGNGTESDAVSKTFRTSAKTLAKEYIVSKHPTGLSANEIGEMLRYQGTDVDNYICLGDGTTCKKTDDNMYRIIGITKDGKIKVMKDKSIGDRTWDNSNRDIAWEKGTLYTYLSGTWYKNLNENIQNMIVTTDWKYFTGRKKEDAVPASEVPIDLTATELYEKENGTDGVTTENVNVGLMQVSDYYLSESENANCYQDACTNTWMFIDKSYQWTMSRYGLYENGNYWDAYRIGTKGKVDWISITNAHVVRPVVYLDPNITIITGDGSQDNPFAARPN